MAVAVPKVAVDLGFHQAWHEPGTVVEAALTPRSWQYVSPHPLRSIQRSPPPLGDGETKVSPTAVTSAVPVDRKSTRLNSSHYGLSRMPSSA